MHQPPPRDEIPNSRINHRSSAHAQAADNPGFRRLQTRSVPLLLPCILPRNRASLTFTAAAPSVCLCCSLRRTARGRSGQGRALLMLLPEELSFLKYLKVGGCAPGGPACLPALLACDCLLSAWPQLPRSAAFCRCLAVPLTALLSPAA